MLKKTQRRICYKAICAIAACAAISAAVIICAAYFSRQKSLDICTSFYFVYCYETEGESTAANFSDTVSDYGGAGYCLEYGSTYYITAACYYSYADALSVCKTLNTRGISCGVLTAERTAYPLTTPNAVKNADLSKGVITTLYELSLIIYQCANGLDTGVYTGSAVKDIMRGVKDNIDFLLGENAQNCFAPHLAFIFDRCTECIENCLYSKYLRAAQIAIADALLNITLT